MKKALIVFALVTFILSVAGGINKIFRSEDNTGNSLLIISVIFSAITVVLFVVYFLKNNKKTNNFNASSQSVKK
jgi:purine-cytosine permease-like protein